MFPEDPKTCTLMSCPGHSVFNKFSSFLINFFLLASLSGVGTNREYNISMSLLSFWSSSGLSFVFTGPWAGSSLSEPSLYGILLLKCAIPVSYGHCPSLDASGRYVGTVELDSEYADLGEWFVAKTGDGSLEVVENFLAR